jgi:hypothetical protein
VLGRRPAVTRTRSSDSVEVELGPEIDSVVPSAMQAALVTVVEVSTRTPLAASAADRASLARGSSLAMRRPVASMMVTSLPSRAKACPSSQPVGPPPRTTRRSGSSVRFHIVSLVNGSVPPSPGTGGRAREGSVATTACRNEDACPPAAFHGVREDTVARHDLDACRAVLSSVWLVGTAIGP